MREAIISFFDKLLKIVSRHALRSSKRNGRWMSHGTMSTYMIRAKRDDESMLIMIDTNRNTNQF